MNRLISCFVSDFKKMNKEKLIQAIKGSEGRVVLSENVASRPSVSIGLTSSEIAKAFGADMILLNGVDVFNPIIHGLDNLENPIKRLKELVGRPIGVNLEPIDKNADLLELSDNVSLGRQCTLESLKKANELGFDFICLTGNPGTGVTNKEILKAIKLARENFNGVIIAGKMHGAGVNEKVLDKNLITEFINAGADIILLPAIGTVPGITLENLTPIIEKIHVCGALAMSAIGTSQESSSKETIKEIALLNKMAGVDIQHIGDAGYGGLAIVENIFELSVAIRGMRHTIFMMSSSNNR